MAEKKEKKSNSVDDIIGHYQKYHHRSGKNFEERIGAFEEFFDSENIHRQQLSQHAQYAVFGKPDDLGNTPGAYNVAYKVLGKHLTEDDAKLEDEDKLAQIMESYADTFLEKAMGKKFKDVIEDAKKNGAKDKDLRDIKGQLLGRYFTDDQGNPINIMNETYIKRNLKGKKKVEIIHRLKDISTKLERSYDSHLHQKALEGVITEEDRPHIAPYIRPIFEQKGFKHEKDHSLRPAMEQLQHYQLFLAGAGEELQKLGYKTIRKKKEDKKSHH